MTGVDERLVFKCHRSDCPISGEGLTLQESVGEPQPWELNPPPSSCNPSSLCCIPPRCAVSVSWHPILRTVGTSITALASRTQKQRGRDKDTPTLPPFTHFRVSTEQSSATLSAANLTQFRSGRAIPSKSTFYTARSLADFASLPPSEVNISRECESSSSLLISTYGTGNR